MERPVADPAPIADAIARAEAERRPALREGVLDGWSLDATTQGNATVVRQFLVGRLVRDQDGATGELALGGVRTDGDLIWFEATDFSTIVTIDADRVALATRGFTQPISEERLRERVEEVVEEPDDSLGEMLARVAPGPRVRMDWRMRGEDNDDARMLVVFLHSLTADADDPLLERLLSRDAAVLEFTRLELSGSALDIPALAGNPEFARQVQSDLVGVVGIPDAVEAAIGHARARHPALGDLPVVLVGLSVGAMMSPPIIEHLAEDLRAAVLVGGGAPSLEVMMRTALPGFTRETSAASSFGSREGVEEALAIMRRANPWNSADSALAIGSDPPILLVDGTHDVIVPSATADTLDDCLGRPERWRVFGGHLALFFALPAMSPRIVDWIEARVREGEIVPAEPIGRPEPARRDEWEPGH